MKNKYYFQRTSGQMAVFEVMKREEISDRLVNRVYGGLIPNIIYLNN
jgi:hypothetical protein